MVKYVIFIKNEQSKLISRAIPKKSVTSSFIQEMKQKKFRKHNVVVEAENEKDAINKINESNEDYFKSLSAFTGDILFYCVSLIIVFLLITLSYYCDLG